MNGFVLAGVAIAAFAAGAALVSFRYERELRRMARFLDQREPTGNARMTAFVRTRGVLGDVLAGLYPQFRERGWEPRVLLDDEAVVQADAEALARIFRNLTANALRHGAAAPVIEQRGGCVTFANLVADPAAIDIDRLFERFYQGGGARSSAGAGLGLAIVSQLAAALGATVAASLEGGVLRVTVELQ